MEVSTRSGAVMDAGMSVVIFSSGGSAAKAAAPVSSDGGRGQGSDWSRFHLIAPIDACHSTSSGSLGRQVLSNQGSSGP